MKKIYKVNNIFSEAFLGGGRSFRLTERRSGSRISRTKPALTMLALLMVCLFGVNEKAWGNDATIANKGTSVSADGITFSLTGTHRIEWGLERYAYLKSGESFSLGWTVPPGYSISVSQVDIETYNVRSLGTTGKGQYKTTKRDTYTQFCQSNSWGTRTLNSSSYFPLGNGASISIKAVDKEMQYKSIKFYYTKTANSHVITLDNETPTTAGSKSVTLTFDSKEHAAITNPQKTNYTFAGWYSGDNGTGSLIIDADGNLQANVDGYTGADGVWKKDATTTLYAKWILNSKKITLDNQSATTAGTAEITVYYNQNVNLTATPAITVPGRTGYTFEGYYTATNGGGLQLIAKNGNVNASVAGYTDANKKWIYDGNKTIYAYWKQNQTITWNGTLADKIRSNTVTLNATASSGLTVTYSASPSDLVSISGNVVTCLKAGTVTITANQSGNGSYNASSNTPQKSFTIAEHQITKNPTATGITYEQTLSNSTLSGGTANVEGTWAWKYPNSVPGAGKADQIAVFTPTSSAISAYPLECNVSVTVAKATPDVPCTIANSYEVDDAPLDLQTLWTREGNGTITYSKVSFTQTGSNNEGATTPAITNNRYLSLGQAGNLRIQMAIAEGSNYVARTVTKDITINKKSNTLSCSWGSWSKNMNVDSQTGVTFSSNNTEKSINIQQTSGNTAGNVIATYSAGTNKITSIYNLGTATWTLSQAEDYKYVAASETLTVNVVKGSTTCYVLQDDAERSWGTINSTTYGDGSVYLTDNGQRLQFQVMRSPITVVIDYSNNDYFDVKYSADGSKWTTLKKLNTLDNMNQWYDFDIDISGLTIKYIKFESETGATGNRHVRNVRITRKKWYKLEDKDGNEISSLTMPTNTLGGNHTTAKFTVDYSTCADQIKVVSNHPHIMVSPASFASEGNGTKEITVTYACDDPEVIDGVITVYTPYENKTLNVHATTEKKSQTIVWSELFAGEPVSLPQTFTSKDAASATSKLPVKYNSGDPEIIAIAEDSLSFTIVGTGTTTLTATQAGNDEWKSVSDSKTINASNKKIQRIVWNQQFTRSLSLDNVIPLTARVYVMNVATGTETESLERTNEIVYTCPDANGVIEILNGTNIHVLGYGNTTITASVAGNEEYEAAASVTLPVRVREIQTGDCDMPLVFEQASEIEFFQSNLDEIIGSPIAINHANGTPDKLSFDVRGAAWKLGIEYYKGSIQVQQSTDNQLSWSSALATVSPAKNLTASSGEVQLDPNATHIRFVRPSGGQGYHYVGNIQITRLPYITTENTTINLGNVSVGENRGFTIPVSYANVKGNMNVTRLYDDNGLTVESAIEAECGDMDSYELQASVLPQSVGPWTNTVTVQDPLSGMFVNIIINATIQKGSQTITWNPTLDILTTEAPTLNAVASSGLTVSYAVTSGNNTVARIEGGQVVILQPGQFTITASQGGNVNYNAAESVAKTFTVTAETLTLIGELTASDITYGQTLLSSTLAGASAEDSKGNAVEGTFSWKTATTAPNAGNAQEFAVVFTPSTNAAWYSTLETTATVNVAKANATLSWTSAPTPLAYNASATYTATSASDGDITYSIISGGSYAHIANTGVLTIDVPGNTITIQASQAEGTNHNVPTPITVDVVINAAPVNEFTNAAGDGDWQNPANWTSVPTGSEPNVIVSGALEIDENVTVGNLTIENTGGVTVITNGTLTVKGTSEDRSGYGDLYVANGGEVDVEGSLRVGDLIVEASIGTSVGNAESGQVAHAEHVVYANAYIDINMDPNNVMDDTKWYGFTVPFAVDAKNGVSRLEGTSFKPCGYGVHYMIAEYDANKRLNTGNGWKYISGNTLNAGQFYFFTVGDGAYNTYRFKALGSTYTPAVAASLSVNGDITNYDANWNGVGNSTLQHVTASFAGGDYVQVFMNGQDAYKTVATGEVTFVVGCPFFIQAKEPTTLMLEAQTSTTEKYYAPRRMQAEATAVSRINLTATDGGYSDQIYFSAVDKEQDAYIIGQDLAKAGESKVVPQLWMAQYGQKLSVHEAAWNGDQATCPLGIYVPKGGEYVLTATQPEDGTQIYLTENGAPIWELTMSEYVLSLEKGNASEYGLMIVRAPRVTTDVENSESENQSVRKVLIDDKIYIVTPDGKMYDIVGKSVKY